MPPYIKYLQISRRRALVILLIRCNQMIELVLQTPSQNSIFNSSLGLKGNVDLTTSSTPVFSSMVYLTQQDLSSRER